MSKSLTYKEHMKIPLTEREAAICEGLLEEVESEFTNELEVGSSNLSYWLNNYLMFTQATCNLRTNGIVETEHDIN